MQIMSRLCNPVPRKHRNRQLLFKLLYNITGLYNKIFIEFVENAKIIASLAKLRKKTRRSSSVSRWRYVRPSTNLASQAHHTFAGLPWLARLA